MRTLMLSTLSWNWIFCGQRLLGGALVKQTAIKPGSRDSLPYSALWWQAMSAVTGR
ncbi:hypothetical protein ACSDR0_46485 [Streptosporangium sp. G11]|uniref:hypothetical protein n=1 Tax=Streptosporangium sp. G11 TaxID=3436926 RepID=UPI003EBA0E7E